MPLLEGHRQCRTTPQFPLSHPACANAGDSAGSLRPVLILKHFFFYSTLRSSYLLYLPTNTAEEQQPEDSGGAAQSPENEARTENSSITSNYLT